MSFREQGAEEKHLGSWGERSFFFQGAGSKDPPPPGGSFLIFISQLPNNIRSSKLNSLMKKAVELEHSHILICGDFNYKEINWHNLDTTVNIEHDASICLENIRDTYLTKHVTKATRYRENQQDSCLDLIFTN